MKVISGTERLESERYVHRLDRWAAVSRRRECLLTAVTDDRRFGGAVKTIESSLYGYQNGYRQSLLLW